MKHPQILLLPLLMFADYFLTVLGAVLRDKGYGDHFKVEHYELNPVWQKPISQKRWVNPRHILLTLFVSCGLAALFEFGGIPDPVREGLFGFLFVFFGMVVGRHLSNILTFLRYARHPEDVSGQIVLTHSWLLRVSTFQYLVAAVPIAIIAVFNPTPFTLGGAEAVVVLIALHCAWIWRHSRSLKRKSATKQPVGPDGK